MANEQNNEKQVDIMANEQNNEKQVDIMANEQNNEKQVDIAKIDDTDTLTASGGVWYKPWTWGKRTEEGSGSNMNAQPEMPGESAVEALASPETPPAETSQAKPPAKKAKAPRGHRHS